MAKFLDLTGLSHFWDKVKAYVDGAISTAKTAVGNYTINGKKISTNPTLAKGDIGLSNVTNDAQVKRSEMGEANGVATLNASGKVPSSQLPGFVDDILEFSQMVSSGTFATSQSSIAGAKMIYWLKGTKKFAASTSAMASSSPTNLYGSWQEGDFASANSYGTPSDSGTTPKSNAIYVDLSTGKTYRWSGTDLVEISPSLALGETSSTAYAGDKGKANRTAIESTPSTIISNVSLGTKSETTVTLNVSKATKSGLNYGSAAAANVVLPAATTTSAGLMSKADKVKLDGLSQVTVPTYNMKVFAGSTDVTNTTSTAGQTGEASLKLYKSGAIVDKGVRFKGYSDIVGTAVKVYTDSSGPYLQIETAFTGTSSQVVMGDGSTASTISNSDIDSLFT